MWQRKDLGGRSPELSLHSLDLVAKAPGCRSFAHAAVLFILQYLCWTSEPSVLSKL